MKVALTNIEIVIRDGAGEQALSQDTLLRLPRKLADVGGDIDVDKTTGLM